MGPTAVSKLLDSGKKIFLLLRIETKSSFIQSLVNVLQKLLSHRRVTVLKNTADDKERRLIGIYESELLLFTLGRKNNTVNVRIT